MSDVREGVIVPVHRIRLNGPWEYVWEDPTDCWKDAAETDGPHRRSGTPWMPRDWKSLFGCRIGTAIFRRPFHCPTNLGPDEQVWLVCTGVGGRGAIHLNDRPLTTFSSCGDLVESELTPHLRNFNVVSIQLTVNAEIPLGELKRGLFQPIVLEIRSD